VHTHSRTHAHTNAYTYLFKSPANVDRQYRCRTVCFFVQIKFAKGGCNDVELKVHIFVYVSVCIYIDTHIRTQKHTDTRTQAYAYIYIPTHIREHIYTHMYVCNIYTCIRRGKFPSNCCPSGRIRQVQNTTSCHTSGAMNLNSIRICTVRGHAPYKYPPRNTMQKSTGTLSNRSKSPGATLPFPLRYSYIYTYMYTYLYMYMYVHIYMNIYVYIQIYKYTYIYVYTYLYI